MSGVTEGQDVPLVPKSPFNRANSPVPFADGSGCDATSPSFIVPFGPRSWARLRIRTLDSRLPAYSCGSARKPSQATATGKLVLAWHGIAWHESNASKHLRPPPLSRFVPHRKLPSLLAIGRASHANTPRTHPRESPQTTPHRAVRCPRTFDPYAVF